MLTQFPVRAARNVLITRLMENAERALQHVAVLDKERKPTGEYRYDGNVANRALELLGKQQGNSCPTVLRQIGEESSALVYLQRL
jgi:hypothetical protein